MMMIMMMMMMIPYTKFYLDLEYIDIMVICCKIDTIFSTMHFKFFCGM